MQYITPEKLREMKACGPEVIKFERFLEGKGWSRARPTHQNLKEARNYGLNIYWPIKNGLVPKEVAIKEAKWAYYYAKCANEKPCKETREAACQYSYWAYKYALCVDKEPHEQTRKAVSQNPYWERRYKREIS